MHSQAEPGNEKYGKLLVQFWVPLLACPAVLLSSDRTFEN